MRKYTQLHKRIVIGYFMILVVFGLVSVLYARFLIDEDEEDIIIEKAAEVPVATYPANTALHIKVEPVHNKMQSVAVSWDLSKGSTDDFIIARSSQLPDTPAIARKAVSLKVVASADEHIVIDNNIPEGSYYYLVLSKKYVAQNKIQLFPNQNYTTNPVIIREKQVIAIKKAPEHVHGIQAEVINDTHILLSWQPVILAHMSFIIYRSNAPISRAELLKNTTRVAIVVEKSLYIDTTVAESGTYFYAVTVKDAQGQENIILKPDENYLTRGVLISMEKQRSYQVKRKKRERIGPKVKKVYGTVDLIIKNTYFKGKYYQAIISLEEFIASHHNQYDISKANLFIGRSYLELGNYSQALNFFIDTTVVKNFPKEAMFWRDYCLNRIK